MISDLKPYPKYRESGLQWLGKVPEHWKQRRTKFLFRERVQKGFPEEPLLAATQSKGVVRKEEYGSRTVTATKDLHLLKLVEQGDYVISLRSFEGGIEVAYSRGIISPAYTVLAPQKEVSQGYYTHFFKSPDFIKSLSLFVTGIREGQNIDYERLSRAYLPLPPSDEQAAIVRFLNWSNGQLEKAIRAKRRVITLLNEQKQAIIHRAVTRGLDPSDPLKPSGVSWLGDIPEHWEVRRISTACDLVVDGTHFSPPNDSVGEFLYITAKNVKEYGIETSNATYIKAMDHRDIYRRCPVRKNDVIYIKDGATAGLATVNNLDEEFSMLSSIALLRPKPSVLFPNFLALSLNNRLFKQNALSKVVGGAMTRFTIALIKRFPLLIPPLSEQLLIVKAVNDELYPILSVQSNVEREIELLREYRTRLVADVVTGKLDVREAAAKLPDEVQTLEFEDDLVVLEEDVDCSL